MTGRIRRYGRDRAHVFRIRPAERNRTVVFGIRPAANEKNLSAVHRRRHGEEKARRGPMISAPRRAARFRRSSSEAKTYIAMRSGEENEELIRSPQRRRGRVHRFSIGLISERPQPSVRARGGDRDPD